MTAGCEVKLTNRIIRAFWAGGDEHRDFRYGCDVGKWLGENQRKLNKTALDKCCKLIMEEFPYVTEVEVRDYAGRISKT
jgi:hypothetical protein